MQVKHLFQGAHKKYEKKHYFAFHFWCVFGKGVHAIRPRRRSPNPQFAYFSALHLKSSKKPKNSNPLRTRGEAICDTAGIRGELGDIWETCGRHLGDIWETSERHLGDIWETFGRHLGRPSLQEWLREERPWKSNTSL